jgi:pimeloyl-ACP methyl ester carboxylesterase
VRPQVRHAKSGDLHVAYVVFGEAALDVVVVPGFISHLEVMWDNPGIVRLSERLMKFARVITFDKRGTGMSDPVAEAPTLEHRMDDLRAVMDAAGSERAVLIGVSEGAPLSILFAAAYPQRTAALVLIGGLARSTWAPDYPWATPKDAILEAAAEFTAPTWGTGANAEVFAPSLAADPAMVDWWGRMERLAASPGMMTQLFMMFLDIDVRAVLPLVQAPTLVLHRTGDRVVNVHAGRYLAEHIPGARFVGLPGRDHAPWAGDVDALAGEVEEFITGTRSVAPEELERVLSTVLFTDVVGSTERAADLGDRRWRELLERHYAAVRAELTRYRGREVKTVGDGVLATFDGPARAVRAAQAIITASRGIGLEIRAGVHTGECEILGDDIGGIAVHTGARIAALAGPGDVLVSSTVKDLVAGSGITFAERGVHELRGIPGEWHLYTAQD